MQDLTVKPIGTRKRGAGTNRANELTRLSEALPWRFGRDIEADDRSVRCLVLAGFFVAVYSEEPDLTTYRILQFNDERNIRHLFAAARRGGSGDLLLYRDGPWEETFRKLGNEMIDLAL